MEQDVPYLRNAIKCPCKSGKPVETCHGSDELAENFEGRLRYLRNRVEKLQSEAEIEQAFSQPLYDQVKDDFIVFREGVRQVSILSMKNGSNMHIAPTIGGDDLGIEPDYIPPQSMTVFVTEGFNASSEGGRFSFSPGLYETYVTAIGRVQGGNGELAAFIRMTSMRANQVEADGKKTRKGELFSDVFWRLIEKKLLFVRSVSMLDYEVFRHSSS